MDILSRAGHTVTHDWTREAVDPEWDLDRQAAYLQRCGAADFEGVVRADALVLVNHPASRDAMAEFGIALGRGLDVFVLYPARRASVFFHRAHLCNTIPELLEELS